MPDGGKYNRYYQDKDAEEIAEDIKPYTFLDPRFQRLGGVENGSGWTFEQSREYLKSLFEGEADNVIRVIDLVDALKYAKREECEKSVAMYKEIIHDKTTFAGKLAKYLSIDGWNSTSTIGAYVKGDYADDLHIDGKTFDQLSKKEKKQFTKNATLRVAFYRDILMDDASRYFRRLNSNTKLTDQEYRQSTLTKLAADIRELAELYWTSVFHQLVFTNKSYRDKRSPDELVAQMILKEEDSKLTVKKNQLDSFYRDHDTIKPTVLKKIAGALKQISKFTDQDESHKKIKKGLLAAVVDLVAYVTDDLKFEILDHKEFWKEILEFDAKMVVESGKVVDADKEKFSYNHWITTFQKPEYYWLTRAVFYKWFENNAQNFETRKIVQKIKTKSYYTFNQKLAAWVKQGGQDRNGHVLDIIDLYKGLLEGDHIKSQADGGETTEENLELMPMEMNRKKGSESWPPHFEHQGGANSQQEIDFAAT